MPFQINGTSPTSSTAEPRSPASGTSYERFLPAEPQGMDGEGRPCAATGYPTYEVYFDILNADDFAWYAAFTGSDPSVALVSLQVYNPYADDGAGSYVTYSSTPRMHRPIYERSLWGGTAYAGVLIRFTELS